ncbi:MAG: hypothetical protein A2Y17_13150 [Clostridiales bacterium GWF2_38_85]|nr:MAG: hypothetical protein A2Y17_13150 [Clostridiales bacterium GWF2_38_85]
MAQALEAIMVVCFGISWPLSIYKSLKAGTAKGKSIFFLIMIFIGYISGISWKLVDGNITYVFWFYVLNGIMVSFDIALYFRNRQLDAKKGA